jgi:hypothetical protein
MVENVADTVANVVDLMANVAIEKPIKLRIIHRYLPEAIGFHAGNQWFPREKPMVSDVETDGFPCGDQWRPAWELMETCVNHYAEAPLPVHASADGRCERSTLSGAKANFERYSQAGNASKSKAFFSTNAKSFVFSCATFQ